MRKLDVADSAEVFTERIAAGLRSLNSALNGSLLLYWTSPKLCMVSLSVVPIVGVGAMSLAKYSRRLNDTLIEYKWISMHTTYAQYMDENLCKWNYWILESSISQDDWWATPNTEWHPVLLTGALLLLLNRNPEWKAGIWEGDLRIPRGQVSAPCRQEALCAGQLHGSIPSMYGQYAFV